MIEKYCYPGRKKALRKTKNIGTKTYAVDVKFSSADIADSALCKVSVE